MDQFNALVGQVQKNTAQIERTLYAITRARLLPADTPPAAAAPKPAAVPKPAAGSDPAPPDQQPTPGLGTGRAGKQGAAAAPAESQEGSPDVPDLQAFYEEFEQHRQQVGGRCASWWDAARAMAASLPSHNHSSPRSCSS